MFWKASEKIAAKLYNSWGKTQDTLLLLSYHFKDLWKWTTANNKKAINNFFSFVD